MVFMLILFLMLGSAGLGAALAQVTHIPLVQNPIHGFAPLPQRKTPQTVPLPPQWSG